MPDFLSPHSLPAVSYRSVPKSFWDYYWLGGITCYYIGRLGKTAWIEKYLKLSHEKLDKTQRFLQGKGSLMGFFAFVPGVGDAIVVALGLMRANLWGVALSMLLGKGIRYYLIAIGVEWIV